MDTKVSSDNIQSASYISNPYYSEPSSTPMIAATQPSVSKYLAVLDPWNKVYYSETPLSSSDIPQGYTNKVQNRMFDSFGAHPDGWNKYFESSYKSPRMAEDNARIAQQNLKAQDSSDGTATGNQLIPSNLGIRKESGTGVGKSSTGLNPFGQLDAGLNI